MILHAILIDLTCMHFNGMLLIDKELMRDYARWLLDNAVKSLIYQ